MTDSTSSKPNVCGRPEKRKNSGRWFSVKRQRSLKILTEDQHQTIKREEGTYPISVHSSRAKSDLAIGSGHLAHNCDVSGILCGVQILDKLIIRMFAEETHYLQPRLCQIPIPRAAAR